jgi:hypothetical protein
MRSPKVLPCAQHFLVNFCVARASFGERMRYHTSCGATVTPKSMQKNIQITTSADRATVQIDLPDAKLALNAVDIDNLLAALAAARAAMVPEHSLDPLQNKEYQAIANPRYWVMPNQVLGGVNLGLRHPGHGWMWFCIPSGDTQALADALALHSSPPPMEGSQSIN